MAYTKINFQNLPNTSTPVNATNLNKMDTELYNLRNADVIDSVDANNYLESGCYYLGTSCTNVPENYVRITVNGSTTSNAAIAQMAIGVQTRKMDYRVKRSGTWSNWIELITSNIETGTITPETGVTLDANNTYLKKNGKIVDVYLIMSDVTIAADTRTTIATLPTGFRPSRGFVTEAVFNYGYSLSGGTQYLSLIYFQTDGKIDFLSHNALSSTHRVRIKATYIID